MTSQGKLLAVDDTAASLKLLTHLLSAEGYEVRAAISGELALHAAASAPPELILLDIRMPGMDGFEVCRRLKAQPATCNVPVIFVSAVTDAEEKLQGFAAGAVDFVTKPYQRDELLARVRTHLDLNRLRYHLEREVEARTAELRQSEQRFRGIFENAADAILLVGLDGRVRDANPAACKMYGYAFDEFVGRHTGKITHPEHVRELDAALASIQAGQNYAVESVNVRKDGTPFPIEVHISPFTHAGESVLLGFIRDITGRRQAEARIAEGAALLAGEQAATIELQRKARLAAQNLTADALSARAKAELATKELRQRNDELARFNLVAVDREMDMIGLKRQVNALSLQLGLAAPFNLAFADAPPDPGKEANDASPPAAGAQ